MENWVFYLLGFGAGMLGLVISFIFGDTHTSYTKEQALIDLLRGTSAGKVRGCAYCGCSFSFRGRCGGCGAPT